MSKELIERLRLMSADTYGNDAADALESLEAAYASAVEAGKALAKQAFKAEQERDAIAEELKALREQEPVGVVDESDEGVFADLETTNGVLVKLGDKLYAHPVPARELTDADIALCIASADKSFAQERISGKPVLGVWSKHLARAIERHLKGVSENG